MIETFKGWPTSLDERGKIWKDLNGLEGPAKLNRMGFNREKCKTLHLSKKNIRQNIGWGEKTCQSHK